MTASRARLAPLRDSLPAVKEAFRDVRMADAQLSMLWGASSHETHRAEEFGAPYG